MKMSLSLKLIPAILFVAAGMPHVLCAEEAAVPASKAEPVAVSASEQNQAPARKIPFFGAAVDYPANHEGAVGLDVLFVKPGSPADLAGLQVGDVLVSVDGQKLFYPNQYVALIRSYKEGDKIKIKYQRGDEIKSTNATLALRPSARQVMAKSQGISEEKAPKDDIRIIINGKEITLSQESEWRDRVAVTPDAIIIRKSSSVPAEMRRMLDSICEKIPDSEVVIRDMKAQYEDARRIVEKHINTFSQVFASNGTTILIVGDDQHREVTVRTKDGGEIFRGPCTTKEDVKAIPDDVKKIISSCMELDELSDDDLDDEPDTENK